MPTRIRRLFPLAGLGAFAILLVLFLNFLAVDAFTLPGDNLIYFLPLIRAHAEEMLRGNLLGMVWGVGAGWSPFESAAVGLAYPMNHLALLLAKILGNDHLMLEVSAALHLWLAGSFAYTLLPATFGRRARWFIALLLMLQPSPILLGRNWHIYLAGYPWFLALALTVWRTLEGGMSPRKRQACWLICGLGMFLGTHPQIYIFAILILMGWILAEAPNRRGFVLILELGLIQLPAAVPLLYIKQLTTHATANMMVGRGDTRLALAFAQSGWTTLQGLFLGNLGGPGGFQVWGGVSGMGIGMFFCPAWILALAFTLKQKRWLLAALLILGFMALGIGSFPWLRWLFLGPLAGFRWTWKLSMLLCPLWLILAIRHWPREFASTRLRTYLGGAQGLAALLVLCLGQSFDLLPSTSSAYAVGVEGLLADTRASLASAGLPPGTRIAVVGGASMADPLPLPLLGLMGAAPLLAGYETPASYEPLEPASVADLHFGLSVPWRIAVPAQAYHDDPAGMERRLREIGVQGLVTRFPDLFPQEGTRAFLDSARRTTFIRVIAPPLPGRYPHALRGEQQIPLSRLAGGALATPPDSDPSPPRLAPDRLLAWSRNAQGQWIGQPKRPEWVWVGAEVLACLLMMVGLGARPDALRP